MQDENGLVVSGDDAAGGKPAPLEQTGPATGAGQSPGPAFSADAAKPLQPPQPSQQKDVQKTLRGRPAKKAAKRLEKKPAKFRLSRFDHDLLELIAAGKTSSQELLNTMLVAPAEFEARVRQLVRRDFLVREKTDPNVLRLGIDGYNFLREKDEKRKQAAAPQPPSQQPSQPQTGSAPAFGGNSLPAAQSRVALELQQQEKERKMLPSEIVESRASLPPLSKEPKEEAMDLDEMFRKGRPHPKQTRPQKRQEQQAHNIPAVPAQPSCPQHPAQQSSPPQAVSASPADAVVASLEKETQSGACELCKSGFKLSLDPAENNPKYAHCFCGAAYHKDCYESIADGDGKCIACGRRMKFRLDRQAEDAVKKIRNLFD